MLHDAYSDDLCLLVKTGLYNAVWYKCGKRAAATLFNSLDMQYT